MSFISGVVSVCASTAQQARAIVNSALRLYSQDKTGMVDFALESGGECQTPDPKVLLPAGGHSRGCYLPHAQQ